MTDIFVNVCMCVCACRFSVSKPIDNKPVDAPRTPSPNRQYGKPREGAGGVLDMDRQRSRWESSYAEEQVGL
jgi:hypothetical protein